VEQDASGSDLKVFVQLIDTYGAEVVIDIVDRLSSEEAAEVVVSTAHKAKGREWASVRIASDFPEPRRSHNGQPAEVPRADAMLAYVAVTRARQALDPQGLAWVDEWL
jgi:superfamily I DNA/RNA helicase